MNEQKANGLAARIREQFPHVSTVVVQSADMRNSPNNWLVGVQRKESFVEGISIQVHSELQWLEALHALFVLQRPAEPPSYDAVHQVQAYRREYEQQQAQADQERDEYMEHHYLGGE